MRICTAPICKNVNYDTKNSTRKTKRILKKNQQQQQDNNKYNTPKKSECKKLAETHNKKHKLKNKMNHLEMKENSVSKRSMFAQYILIRLITYLHNLGL